ncbi:MAG: DUF1289 domain-containing protein [Betaproteobacteria bacterium]|nr:DUF1289 domain-containing protein [Betaproteobacteria bacterium]
MTAPLPSPCINVCRMDEATGWCAGCLRTLDEIALWSRLAEADKRAVWEALAQRRVLWLQQGRGPLPAAASAAAP